MTYHFETDCVNSTAELINDMVDSAKETTYEELILHVTEEQLKEVFPNYEWSDEGLELRNDYAVSFYRSQYNGMPCYYIEHSMIEHVFTEE